MPVSPRDFELYSRMTGKPMPMDAQQRMQMAPEVFQFSKNFAKKPTSGGMPANENITIKSENDNIG